MSLPDPPSLNTGAILRALIDNQVEFVLVGGIASAGHGSTRLTKDLDVCPAWSDGNLDRLALALRSLGAMLKIGEGSVDVIAVELDAAFIRRLEIGAWRTRAGDIDVLLGIPHESRWQLAQYAHLKEHAVAVEIEGTHVLIASLQDIVRSKEIADRPKDQEALPELRQLLAQQHNIPSTQGNLPPATQQADPRQTGSASPPPASSRRRYGTEAERPWPPGGSASDGPER